jgi:hypothetical protein
MTNALHVLDHPDRCRCLLSKGLYINAGLKPEQYATGDGNYWCSKTQTIFGPDAGLCSGEHCLDRSRTCYVAPY